MARACPACGRPNSDAALACLYCSAPLPDAPAGARREPGVEEVATDRHLLVLLPGGEPDPRALQAFVRLTDLSTYDARMSLTTRRPRVFRRLGGGEEAKRFSRALTEARIPHYVVSESSVLSVPVSRLRALALHERHASLDAEGTEMVIPYDDLLLLVRGEIQRERHDEKRLGTARGASQSVTPSLRLHLYSRQATVAAEIDPESFDWSVLGEARTASALVNLHGLVTRLMDRAPGATLDRGFDEEPAVLSRAGTPQDVASALAAGERASAGVVYDNEGQFRFYSRWRSRLEKHLAAHRAPRQGSSYTPG